MTDPIDTARAECIALGPAMALLKEAAADLTAYVESDYPATMRAAYPSMQRRWDRDMDLVPGLSRLSRFTQVP